MDKSLLPIGTVVQLKNSDALAMIAGYLPVMPSEPDKVYDYSGFRFPLGYVNDNEVYCFDADQIEIIYAYGYLDYESDVFLKRLELTKEELKNKNEETNKED